MTDNFVGGYTKAICDIRRAFECMRENHIRITTKSIFSFIDLLIYNHDVRELFRDTGGIGVLYVVNPKNEIINIRR